MTEIDPIITINDLRPFVCVRGIRKAFAASDRDFDGFLKNGARASSLRGHGYDGIIDRVAQSVVDRSDGS